ncbi:MAG: 6-carboxytetrahydropterin synthase [Pseudomonadota bacterium]
MGYTSADFAIRQVLMGNGVKSTTKIEVYKENMKFSAAHFTIFSATERERLHGHNFAVYAMIEAPVGENGMCFSYVELKDRLRALCHELDEYLVLPAHSPYLTIDDDDPYYRVRFAAETMLFLKSDTLVLPIRNSTVEEYSRYLLSQLLADAAFVATAELAAVEIKVSSGPGQSGSATWVAV